MSAFNAIVLAAGQGTRMKSARSKVLHEIAGLPLVSHVLNAASSAGAAKCALVVPPASEGFEKVTKKAPVTTEVFVQAERLGTAHAVLAARPALDTAEEAILVLYGDTPLVLPESLKRLLAALQHGADLALLGFYTQNPFGYGRLIVRNDKLDGIVEEKDATPEERAITFCNSGIMAFRKGVALPLLDSIGNNNRAGEYYLTDAVGLAKARGLQVALEEIDEDEVRGVNTRVQLAEAEAVMQRRLRIRAMEAGATLVAPETVTLCHDTVIGRDVLIEPHVIFGPGTVIEDDVTIKGFSHIEGAYLESGSSVGPFARLRPGTVIGRGGRIGNFVEVKQARFGAGAKANHLSYIGDSDVGDNANIGAGTITCNYDGFNKHRTEIGEGAFIGSNSALVAPVKVGNGAYIGTGSIITKDVPADALAMTRAPQIEREDWARRYRLRHAKPSSRNGGQGPEEEKAIAQDEAAISKLPGSPQ